MEEELDLLLEKGYWFSLIPKDKKKWHATIWKRNPSKNWDGIAWKETKSLKQGMKFVEKYLGKELMK